MKNRNGPATRVYPLVRETGIVAHREATRHMPQEIGRMRSQARLLSAKIPVKREK